MSPALSWMSAWISGIRLGPRQVRVEVREHDLRDLQPERARNLPRHQLRDQRPRALPRAAKLQHIQPVIVGLDDGGKRAAFAQRRDVAGHGNRTDRAHGAIVPCITDRRGARISSRRDADHSFHLTGRGLRGSRFHGTRITRISSPRDADYADLISTGRGLRGSRLHGTRITRISSPRDADYADLISTGRGLRGSRLHGTRITRISSPRDADYADLISTGRGLRGSRLHGTRITRISRISLWTGRGSR